MTAGESRISAADGGRMRSRTLALVAAVVALALVGGGLFAYRQLTAPAPRFAVATVGAQRLTLSSAYLRPSRDGMVELVAFFPDFAPAGAFADVAAATNLDDRFARLVFIELKPADPALDPAERTSRLYERFLDENSWSHPGGLVARAFVDGSPFEGDELFYVAPEGRDFAARCRRPDPSRKTPNTCAADFRLGDLDVELRFAASLLAQWSALKQGALGLIETAKR
jgi:hypothetical protein